MVFPNVLMVFPRFNQNSFWSLQAACDISGARCPAPPLGLITVAALLPQTWNIRLVNRNAETLTVADLEWADMVMTGGMLPQRYDTHAIMQLCRQLGKPVVVGGPDAMSSPDDYSAANFLILGEAEGLIDKFVDAWSAGERQGVFEAERFKADITQSPIPRFDLINLKHYLYVGVQFSRGCPFTCEFCDIIELYGRSPRPKTNDQMLRELQALYDVGHRGHVDFVDDNLIGNKKALRRFLPVLIAWQREHRYPFQFSTEASMNLADDAELLAMMKAANFFCVFMGIETPDTATLLATSKKQNTRRSLADSIQRIYAAGMFVVAGFIVGFDAERDGVAEAMIECIEATSIPMCMVGLLTALPNTQLTRRLKSEGRHLPFNTEHDEAGDQCVAGLNFVTLRPRRDILADYKRVLEAVYRPETFFERVRAVGRALQIPKHDEKFRIMVALKDGTLFARLIWQITVRHPELRRLFWRTFTDTLRNNPRALDTVISLMVLYLHLGPFAAYVVAQLDQQIAALDVPPQLDETKVAAE